MGLEFLFYIFAIPALLWELINITSVTKVHNFMNRLKDDEVKLANKGKTEQNVAFLMILYAVWMLIGLFSSQYILFLFLLTISFIPKKYRIIRFVDGVISFLVILFIILNKYHFGINLCPIISEFVYAKIV
jgi:hypothetical protein